MKVSVSQELFATSTPSRYVNSSLFSNPLFPCDFNPFPLQDFGRLDKKQILTDCGSSVLDCIVSGEAIANPALLHNFQLITFADLKSYKFVFWFGMPAVSTAQSWELRSSELVHGDETKAPLLQGDVLRAVYERVLQQNTMDVFVVERSSDVHNVLSLREAWEKRYSSDLTFVLLDMSSAKQGLGWNVRNLLTLLTFYAGCGEGCSSYDDEHFSISTEFKSIKLLSIRNPSIKHILNR